MNATQVKIGNTYRCKIGRNVVEVRIDCTSQKGGWDGTLLSTGKCIAIRNAKRLSGPAAEQKKEKEPAQKTPTHLSCIDAAAKILQAAKESLGCKEIIQAMTSEGLWSSPGGRTPANTLYSAILREIKARGPDSRFVKVERGRFAIQE